MVEHHGLKLVVVFITPKGRDGADLLQAGSEIVPGDKCQLDEEHRQQTGSHHAQYFAHAFVFDGEIRRPVEFKFEQARNLDTQV